MYRTFASSDTKKRAIVPSHLIEEVITKVHGSELCAHGGTEKTSFHLRSLWFPGFYQRIQSCIQLCEICLKSKGVGNQYNILHTRKPATILDRVFIDIV